MAAKEGVDSKSAKPFEVTSRTVLAISVPVTLAFLTTPLLGIVDTAVVGRYESAALTGGLGVGAILFDILLTTINFLRSGTTGLVAQAHGADDEKEKQAILFRSLTIALVIGTAFLIMMPVFLPIGLWIMGPTPAVAEATRTYFLIRMISAPFALGNYVILGWLLGSAHSGLALLVQLLLNGTNILFSILLGLWLEWDIAGVAFGTVIAEVFAFVIGGIICWNMMDHSVRPSRQRIANKDAWKRMINLNGDILIRSFALLFAFAYFTKQGTGFGETLLAANTVLMNFFMLAGYMLDGLATAAEQICGRAVGARYRAGFWQGVKLSSFWNLILAAICTVAFIVLGPQLVDVINTNEEIRTEAYQYLLWVAFIPLTGVLAFQMDGIYIGATWSREMSIWMLVSLAAYLLIWQVVREPYGNHGLWFSLHCFLMIRGVTLAWRLPKNVKQTFG